MIHSRHTGSMRGGSRHHPQPAPHLVIGVTGHRKLEAVDRIEPLLPATIDAVIGLLPPGERGRARLTILTPLAEGADRLVAREVLRRPGSRLHAVLPLPRKEYERDFDGQSSRDEFAGFLERAVQVDELPPRATRTAAYLAVGQFVVDRCDVLVALWDGLPPAGEGGTGSIVDYARGAGCPLFWIRTVAPFDVRYEPGYAASAHGLRRARRHVVPALSE